MAWSENDYECRHCGMLFTGARERSAHEEDCRTCERCERGLEDDELEFCDQCKGDLASLDLDSHEPKL